MIRLLIADDHPIVLKGIEGLFAADAFQVTGTFTDGAAAMAQIEAGVCDIAVVDLHMPGLSGLEILRRSRELDLPARIVILTSSIDDDDLVEAIRLKADGLVLKETAASLLVTCVQTVAAGGQWIDRDAMGRALLRLSAPQPAAAGKLTAREADVARSVALGLRNKEIAEKASISEGTVKMHLHNIYEKLGIGSRTELAIYVRDVGVA